MDVLLLLVIIAILVGVFFVAIGKGGELAYEQPDHAPLDLGLVSATDIALLRPPTALWGYNMQVTDEALDVIARALRDRDIEIAYLQRQLADLGQEVPAKAGMERAREFAPKHASGLSSDDTADPWSRLWSATGQATVADQAVADQAVADQAAADQAAADKTAADQAAVVEQRADTASLPAAEDTAVTTHAAQPDASEEPETSEDSNKDSNEEEEGW